VNIDEQALVFDCGGEQLFGVLARPEQPHDIGVLVVVGGPQYRVGSHRQFVALARALAAGGYPVLRFDYRGMGDSSGAMRSFETIDDDIDAAVAELRARLPAVRRVVLWGLCDGASAALLYCARRPSSNVAGLCLLNPWVRSAEGLARTQIKHYYGQRLLQPAFWSKLLRGGVAPGALREWLHNWRVARTGRQVAATTFQQRMAQGWREFGGGILLLLSGNDYTAREFVDHSSTDNAWAGLLAQPNVQRHDLPGADHTCSGAQDRMRVQQTTLNWLDALHRH
jgi:exosortase A-associated hydrolase 1